MIDRRIWATGILCTASMVALACTDTGTAKSDNEGTSNAPAVIRAPEGKTEIKAMTPIRLPGELVPAPWLGDATKVIALGEGESAMIVAAGVGWLRWFSPAGTLLGERLGPGAPQVLQAFDLDGDGSSEVIFARGMGRNAADAKRVLEILRIHGEESEAEAIALPETTRQQIAGVAKAAGDQGALWVASFSNKFEVEVGLYQKNAEGWTKSEDRGRHRVVSDIAVLDSGVPVIARMYGDTADAPGGVFELPKGKSPQPIPSTRGARALTTLPGLGQLVMADGWDKNYGRKAQGLVTIAARKSWGWTKVSSVEVAENYGFTELRVGNLHREKGPEIIASGNGPAIVVTPTRPDLLYSLGDVVAADAFPVNLHGDVRDEVVIAGPKPAIWSPR